MTMRPGEIRTVHIEPKANNGHIAWTNVVVSAGRRRKIRGYGANPTQAEADLRRKVATLIGSPDARITDTSTYTELCRLWCQAVQRSTRLSIGTRNRYTGVAGGIITANLGEYTLAELTVPVLENFLQRMLLLHSPQYVKLIRTVLIQSLQYAVRMTPEIPRNNARETTPIYIPPRQARTLTPDEVTWFRHEFDWWLHQPSGHRQRTDIAQDVIEVILGTSARPSEAIALQVKHIDTAGHRVHITSTIVPDHGRVVHQGHAKSSRQHRWIDVPDFAWRIILARWAAVRDHGPDAYLFHAAGKPSRPYLLCGLDRTLRQFRIQHPRLRPQLPGLDLSGITFMTFRKTAATIVADALGIQSASELLGHSSPKITRTYYVPARDRTVDSTVTDALQAAFGTHTLTA